MIGSHPTLANALYYEGTITNGRQHLSGEGGARKNGDKGGQGEGMLSHKRTSFTEKDILYFLLILVLLREGTAFKSGFNSMSGT